MLKIYRKNIVVFYILTAAALIAAVFVDLKLDILLNSPENAFAVWFYNTGEIDAVTTLYLFINKLFFYV